MELVHAHQISFQELLNEQIDVVIAACGYESRSRHLVETSNFSAKKKIAFLFKENVDNDLVNENKIIFENEGFECYEISSESSEELIHLLKKISITSVTENIKLVVDYSSMAKIWYGTIINFFALQEMFCKKLIVYFCYTPEHFLPKKALKKEKYNLYPLISHKNSKTTNKPLALILGLGEDSEKAQFLCDFFKPDDVHLFFPDPAFDEKHAQSLKESNEKLFSKVKSTHLHLYPAKNIEEIDSRLGSICLGLRLKYRLILVSLGPKTFSLASFLLNTRYPDIEIWHLSGDDHQYDLQAADIPIVYKAVLTNEDDEY
jgi:hypothetical protein